MYYEKYLKYKTKYLKLKEQLYGGDTNSHNKKIPSDFTIAKHIMHHYNDNIKYGWLINADKSKILDNDIVNRLENKTLKTDDNLIKLAVYKNGAYL